jgi:hypothetical protein
MKVELLQDDNNKQELLMFESVTVTQVSLNLQGNHLTTRHMWSHEDPTSGNSSR